MKNHLSCTQTPARKASGQLFISAKMEKLESLPKHSVLLHQLKNYHLHAGKLEFLALKWAITEQFRDYLYYAPEFTVYTDNNPLTYVPTSAKLNAASLRWVGELADFRFQIKYRPGKSNNDADTLSRLPLNIEDFMQTCCEGSSSEVVQAPICSARLQS